MLRVVGVRVDQWGWSSTLLKLLNIIQLHVYHFTETISTTTSMHCPICCPDLTSQWHASRYHPSTSSSPNADYKTRRHNKFVVENVRHVTCLYQSQHMPMKTSNGHAVLNTWKQVTTITIHYEKVLRVFYIERSARSVKTLAQIKSN